MPDARSNSYITLNQRKPFKVVVCATTLVAFCVNIFMYDLAWAGGTPSELTSVGSDRATGAGLLRELDPATFKLPDSLGTIKDSWKPGGVGQPNRQTIIHIQDAHCNYYAQTKIAEIVEYLNKEYGIDTINLEGGAEGYDLSPFTDIKDKTLRAKASDHFVMEGLVNGAEYFAVNNPEKVTLWGIEDPKLYVDNLRIYRNSLKNKEAIDKHLKSLSSALSALKTKIYSKELFEFDLKYSQYKASNLEFKDYLDYLIQKARGMSIDIKKFTDIYLLSQALDEESNIDFNKANNERDSLIDVLQKKLSKRLLEELVVKSVEFKADKISQKDYYGYLVSKAQTVRIDLKEFPELEKYIVYIAMYDAINKANVMEELGTLEDSIKAGLCRTDEERKLLELSKNLALLKNIFGISITRQDYEYYKKNESSFSVRNYISFITDKALPYGITVKLDENIRDLDKYREDMIGFFEYSLKRDKAFLENIRLGDGEKLSAKRPSTSSGLSRAFVEGRYPLNANRVALLITGGFHTENLAELFKKSGISYVSIMPNFRNEEGYVCNYYKLLSGEKSLDLRAQLPSVLNTALAIKSSLCPGINNKPPLPFKFVVSTAAKPAAPTSPSGEIDSGLRRASAPAPVAQAKPSVRKMMTEEEAARLRAEQKAAAHEAAGPLLEKAGLALNQKNIEYLGEQIELFVQREGERGRALLARYNSAIDKVISLIEARSGTQLSDQEKKEIYGLFITNIRPLLGTSIKYWSDKGIAEAAAVFLNHLDVGLINNTPPDHASAFAVTTTYLKLALPLTFQHTDFDLTSDAVERRLQAPQVRMLESLIADGQAARLIFGGKKYLIRGISTLGGAEGKNPAFVLTVAAALVPEHVGTVVEKKIIAKNVPKPSDGLNDIIATRVMSEMLARHGVRGYDVEFYTPEGGVKEYQKVWELIEYVDNSFIGGTVRDTEFGLMEKFLASEGRDNRLKALGAIFALEYVLRARDAKMKHILMPVGDTGKLFRIDWEFMLDFKSPERGEIVDVLSENGDERTFLNALRQQPGAIALVRAGFAGALETMCTNQDGIFEIIRTELFRDKERPDVADEAVDNIRSRLAEGAESVMAKLGMPAAAAAPAPDAATAKPATATASVVPQAVVSAASNTLPVGYTISTTEDLKARAKAMMISLRPTEFQQKGVNAIGVEELNNFINEVDKENYGGFIIDNNISEFIRQQLENIIRHFNKGRFIEAFAGIFPILFLFHVPEAVFQSGEKDKIHLTGPVLTSLPLWAASASMVLAYLFQPYALLFIVTTSIYTLSWIVSFSTSMNANKIHELKHIYIGYVLRTLDRNRLIIDDIFSASDNMGFDQGLGLFSNDGETFTMAFLEKIENKIMNRVVLRPSNVKWVLSNGRANLAPAPAAAPAVLETPSVALPTPTDIQPREMALEDLNQMIFYHVGTKNAGDSWDTSYSTASDVQGISFASRREDVEQFVGSRGAPADRQKIFAVRLQIKKPYRVKTQADLDAMYEGYEKEPDLTPAEYARKHILSLGYDSRIVDWPAKNGKPAWIEVQVLDTTIIKDIGEPVRAIAPDAATAKPALAPAAASPVSTAMPVAKSAVERLHTFGPKFTIPVIIHESGHILGYILSRSPAQAFTGKYRITLKSVIDAYKNLVFEPPKDAPMNRLQGMVMVIGSLVTSSIAMGLSVYWGVYSIEMIMEGYGSFGMWSLAVAGVYFGVTLMWDLLTNWILLSIPALHDLLVSGPDEEPDIIRFLAVLTGREPEGQIEGLAPELVLMIVFGDYTAWDEVIGELPKSERADFLKTAMEFANKREHVDAIVEYIAREAHLIDGSGKAYDDMTALEKRANRESAELALDIIRWNTAKNVPVSKLKEAIGDALVELRKGPLSDSFGDTPARRFVIASGSTQHNAWLARKRETFAKDGRRLGLEKDFLEKGFVELNADEQKRGLNFVLAAVRVFEGEAAVENVPEVLAPLGPDSPVSGVSAPALAVKPAPAAPAESKKSPAPPQALTDIVRGYVSFDSSSPLHGKPFDRDTITALLIEQARSQAESGIVAGPDMVKARLFRTIPEAGVLARSEAYRGFSIPIAGEIKDADGTVLNDGQIKTRYEMEALCGEDGKQVELFLKEAHSQRVFYLDVNATIVISGDGVIKQQLFGHIPRESLIGLNEGDVVRYGIALEFKGIGSSAHGGIIHKLYQRVSHDAVGLSGAAAERVGIRNQSDMLRYGAALNAVISDVVPLTKGSPAGKGVEADADYEYGMTVRIRMGSAERIGWFIEKQQTGAFMRSLKGEETADEAGGRRQAIAQKLGAGYGTKNMDTAFFNDVRNTIALLATGMVDSGVSFGIGKDEDTLLQISDLGELYHPIKREPELLAFLNDFEITEGMTTQAYIDALSQAVAGEDKTELRRLFTIIVGVLKLHKSISDYSNPYELAMDFRTLARGIDPYEEGTDLIRFEGEKTVYYLGKRLEILDQIFKAYNNGKSLFGDRYFVDKFLKRVFWAEPVLADAINKEITGEISVYFDSPFILDSTIAKNAANIIFKHWKGYMERHGQNPVDFIIPLQDDSAMVVSPAAVAAAKPAFAINGMRPDASAGQPAVAPASRGMSGLDNIDYTLPIQKAIRSGNFGAVDVSADGNIALADLLLDDGSGTVIKSGNPLNNYQAVNLFKAIRSLSEEDRALLAGSQILLIPGLDEAVRSPRAPPNCYGTHYGVSRNQYYIDTNRLSNPEELAAHLLHEIRERAYALAGLNADQLASLRNRDQGSPLDVRINTQAKEMHELLTVGYTLSSEDAANEEMDPSVQKFIKANTGKPLSYASLITLLEDIAIAREQSGEVVRSGEVGARLYLKGEGESAVPVVILGNVWAGLDKRPSQEEVMETLQRHSRDVNSELYGVDMNSTENLKSALVTIGINADNLKRKGLGLAGLRKLAYLKALGDESVAIAELDRVAGAKTGRQLIVPLKTFLYGNRIAYLPVSVTIARIQNGKIRTFWGHVDPAALLRSNPELIGAHITYGGALQFKGCGTYSYSRHLVQTNCRVTSTGESFETRYLERDNTLPQDFMTAMDNIAGKLARRYLNLDSDKKFAAYIKVGLANPDEVSNYTLSEDILGAIGAYSISREKDGFVMKTVEGERLYSISDRIYGRQKSPEDIMKEILEIAMRHYIATVTISGLEKKMEVKGYGRTKMTISGPYDISAPFEMAMLSNRESIDFVISERQVIPELRGQPGMYLGGVYQSGAGESIGTVQTADESSAELLQSMVLDRGAAIGAQIVDLFPTGLGSKSNQDLAQVVRVRVSGVNRMTAVDLLWNREPSMKIDEFWSNFKECAAEISDRKKEAGGNFDKLFQNQGHNIAAFFNARVLFNAPEMYEGKDIDILGYDNDMGEYSDFNDSGLPEDVLRTFHVVHLVKKLRFLAMLHAASENALMFQSDSRLLGLWLENLFGRGNEKAVEKVKEYLCKNLSKEALEKKIRMSDTVKDFIDAKFKDRPVSERAAFEEKYIEKEVIMTLGRITPGSELAKAAEYIYGEWEAAQAEQLVARITPQGALSVSPSAPATAPAYTEIKYETVTSKNSAPEDIEQDIKQMVDIWGEQLNHLLKGEEEMSDEDIVEKTKYFKMFMRSPKAKVYVARSVEGVVGFVIADYDGDFGSISYMAVRSASQEQGIGTRLFKNALDWLLEVNKTNRRKLTSIILEDMSKGGATGRMALKSGFRLSTDPQYNEAWMPPRYVLDLTSTMPAAVVTKPAFAINGMRPDASAGQPAPAKPALKIDRAKIQARAAATPVPITAELEKLARLALEARIPEADQVEAWAISHTAKEYDDWRARELSVAVGIQGPIRVNYIQPEVAAEVGVNWVAQYGDARKMDGSITDWLSMDTRAEPALRSTGMSHELEHMIEVRFGLRGLFDPMVLDKLSSMVPSTSRDHDHYAKRKEVLRWAISQWIKGADMKRRIELEAPAVAQVFNLFGIERYAPLLKPHNMHIEDALKSGKSIPANVLSEYPGIAARYSAPAPSAPAGAMKNIGLDEDTGEEARKVLELVRSNTTRLFLVEDDESIPSLADSDIRKGVDEARIKLGVVDTRFVYGKDIGVDLGTIPATHIIHEGVLFIILNNNLPPPILEEAVYHELREAVLVKEKWVQKFALSRNLSPERIAHIVASNQQAGRQEGRSVLEGGITPYHAEECRRIAGMTSADLLRFMAEDRSLHAAALEEAARNGEPIIPDYDERVRAAILTAFNKNLSSSIVSWSNLVNSAPQSSKPPSFQNINPYNIIGVASGEAEKYLDIPEVPHTLEGLIVLMEFLADKDGNGMVQKAVGRHLKGLLEADKSLLPKLAEAVKRNDVLRRYALSDDGFAGVDIEDWDMARLSTDDPINFLRDKTELKMFLFVASILRLAFSQYILDEPEGDPGMAPLGYARSKGYIFDYHIDKNGSVAICPIAESYRRHIIVVRGPAGSERALEIKVPGELEDKRVINKANFDIAVRAWTENGEECQVVKPVAVVRSNGVFGMYGRILRADNTDDPMNNVLLEYSDGRRLARIRAGFEIVNNDYMNAVLENINRRRVDAGEKKRMLSELKRDVALQTIRAGKKLLDMGYRGYCSEGTDFHIENFRLQLDGTVVSVADFGAFEEAPEYRGDPESARENKREDILMLVEPLLAAWGLDFNELYGEAVPNMKKYPLKDPQKTYIDIFKTQPIFYGNLAGSFGMTQPQYKNLFIATNPHFNPKAATLQQNIKNAYPGTIIDPKILDQIDDILEKSTLKFDHSKYVLEPDLLKLFPIRYLGIRIFFWNIRSAIKKAFNAITKLFIADRQIPASEAVIGIAINGLAGYVKVRGDVDDSDKALISAILLELKNMAEAEELTLTRHQLDVINSAVGLDLDDGVLKIIMDDAKISDKGIGSWFKDAGWIASAWYKETTRSLGVGLAVTAMLYYIGLGDMAPAVIGAFSGGLFFYFMHDKESRSWPVLGLAIGTVAASAALGIGTLSAGALFGAGAYFFGAVSVAAGILAVLGLAAWHYVNNLPPQPALSAKMPASPEAPAVVDPTFIDRSIERITGQVDIQPEAVVLSPGTFFRRAWPDAGTKDLAAVFEYVWNARRGIPDENSALPAGFRQKGIMALPESMMRLPYGFAERLISAMDGAGLSGGRAATYIEMLLDLNFRKPDDMDALVELCDFKDNEKELQKFLWMMFYYSRPDLHNRGYGDIPEGLRSAISESLSSEGTRRILDIGCGPSGATLAGIRKKFGERVDAYGVNLFIDSTGKEGIKLIEGDILRGGLSTFPDGYFDVVYEVAFLEYYKDRKYEAILEEVARVLKPGGRFIPASIQRSEVSRRDAVLRAFGPGSSVVGESPCVIQKPGAELIVELPASPPAAASAKPAPAAALGRSALSYDDPQEFARAAGYKDAIAIDITDETSLPSETLAGLDAFKNGKGEVAVLLDFSKLPLLTTKDNAASAGVCIEHFAMSVGRAFGRDSDVYYPMREILKNAIYHGNKMNPKLPILIVINAADNRITGFKVYDRASKKIWNPLARFAGRRAGMAGGRLELANIRKAGFIVEPREPILDNGRPVGAAVTVTEAAVPAAPVVPATQADLAEIKDSNPDVKAIKVRMRQDGTAMIAVHFLDGSTLEFPRKSTKGEIENGVQEKRKELEAIENKRAEWNKDAEDFRERMEKKYPGLIIEYIMPGAEFREEPEDAKYYLIKCRFIPGQIEIPIKDADAAMDSKIAGTTGSIKEKLISAGLASELSEEDKNMLAYLVYRAIKEKSDKLGYRLDPDKMDNTSIAAALKASMPFLAKQYGIAPAAAESTAEPAVSAPAAAPEEIVIRIAPERAAPAVAMSAVPSAASPSVYEGRLAMNDEGYILLDGKVLTPLGGGNENSIFDLPDGKSVLRVKLIQGSRINREVWDFSADKRISPCVRDTGFINGHPFIVVDKVDGKTLDKFGQLNDQQLNAVFVLFDRMLDPSDGLFDVIDLRPDQIMLSGSADLGYKAWFIDADLAHRYEGTVERLAESFSSRISDYQILPAWNRIDSQGKILEHIKSFLPPALKASSPVQAESAATAPATAVAPAPAPMPAAVLSSAYLGVLNEKQRVWQTSISEPKLKAPDTTIPTSTDESRAATVTGAGTVVVSAENMYARAREIIPQITRELFSGAPTFDTAPVPDLDMPATTGFNNAIKRMMGSSGHQIMVRHYKMGETEKDALDNVNKEITDTVDLFDSAVKQSTVKNDGKITSTARWIVRVLSTEMRSEVVGRIENRLRELNTFDGKLNEEAFNIAKDRVKVIVVNIEGAKHLNTVIDLLVDISMMEMHRYMIGDNVGPATSDFKSNVTNLLNMSATKLPAGSIEEIILAIFDGAEFVLRAFDWGELDKEWKRVQKVLIAA